MNKERFEELSEAIRQAKSVRRGEAAPSRVWNVTRAKDGKLHRRQLDPKVGKHRGGHALEIAALARQICRTAGHIRQDAA